MAVADSSGWAARQLAPVPLRSMCSGRRGLWPRQIQPLLFSGRSMKSEKLLARTQSERTSRSNGSMVDLSKPNALKPRGASRHLKGAFHQRHACASSSGAEPRPRRCSAGQHVFKAGRPCLSPATVPRHPEVAVVAAFGVGVGHCLTVPA